MYCNQPVIETSKQSKIDGDYQIISRHVSQYNVIEAKKERIEIIKNMNQ